MPTSSLDVLYKRVAKKVLSETLGLKKGESLTVETWNNGFDFATTVVAEARAMGCPSIMLFEDEATYVDGVMRSPKDSLGLMGKHEYNLLAGTDGYVFIPGQALGAYSKTLSQVQRDDSTRYNDSWYDAATKAKLRGARLSFGYIGKDLAKMLGMTIEEAVSGQLRAALTDFDAVSKSADFLSSSLSNGTSVTVDSGGASLRFTLKGDMEVQDGTVDEKDLAAGNNMAYVPPGQVYKEFDPASVDGTVKVSPTLTKYGYLGRTELKFKDGKLVSWKSEDKAKLTKLLDPLPEARRRLVFMGIGMNPALKFGLAQDRFVRGAVTLGGLGFSALVKGATVTAGSSKLVSRGVLEA